VLIDVKEMKIRKQVVAASFEVLPRPSPQETEINRVKRRSGDLTNKHHEYEMQITPWRMSSII
jgi:hypothetical protein